MRLLWTPGSRLQKQSSICFVRKVDKGESPKNKKTKKKHICDCNCTCKSKFRRPTNSYGTSPAKKENIFGPPNYIVPWIFRHKIIFLFVENLCQDCPVEIHHSKNIRHLIGQIGAEITMFSFSEPHVSSDGSATNSMKPTLHNWAYLAAVSEPPRS